LQKDVVELFIEILSRESVTPDDGGLMEFFEEYLSDFEAIRVDKNGVKNLFLTKKFGDASISVLPDTLMLFQQVMGGILHLLPQPLKMEKYMQEALKI